MPNSDYPKLCPTLIKPREYVPSIQMNQPIIIQSFHPTNQFHSIHPIPSARIRFISLSLFFLFVLCIVYICLYLYIYGLLQVDEIIRELGLLKIADTLVGTQFSRGISGGERRRLGILYP